MFVFCRLMTTDCTIGDHEKKKNTNTMGSTNRRFASPPPRYQVSGERLGLRRAASAVGATDAAADRSGSVAVIDTLLSGQALFRLCGRVRPSPDGFAELARTNG